MRKTVRVSGLSYCKRNGEHFVTERWICPEFRNLEKFYECLNSNLKVGTIIACLVSEPIFGKGACTKQGKNVSVIIIRKQRGK